jgi:hypothetical protein
MIQHGLSIQLGLKNQRRGAQRSYFLIMRRHITLHTLAYLSFWAFKNVTINENFTRTEMMMIFLL